jgi:hypothetical protein
VGHAFYDLRRHRRGQLVAVAEGAQAMIIESQAADPAVHQAAMQMARACRHIVQACLREDEWRLADTEFYRVIRAGLEQFRADAKGGR